MRMRRRREDHMPMDSCAVCSLLDYSVVHGLPMVIGLWHADKLLIQAEVAANLANLLHALGTMEGGMRYLGAGLWTIQQRWDNIDKYRIDKYLSLLRQLLRQALLLLARHQWRSEDIALWANVMKNIPFGSIISSDPTRVLPLCPGIALHFADIFLDELQVV